MRFFTDADLRGANCESCNFNSARLQQAKLQDANFKLAELDEADLTGAFLASTDLTHASLLAANLTHADLTNAILTGAQLYNANLYSAVLSGTNLENAEVWATLFNSIDLSTAKGLLTIKHRGPSSIDVDTLFLSNGRIPDRFLLDAGIPDDFVTYVPSLVGRAIEFYSCFISYSHRDEEFAEHLYSRMKSENLRVWYAPEEIRSGRKLHEQVFTAIQVHDKLLVILSEDSMQSEWVMTEIRRARKVELEENRRKLFPIRLVDYDVLKKWECFDPDTGKDLAVEVREYYVPDFSEWRDAEAFQVEFSKLLRSLMARN
jgi:TIR domain/Pentapeptide repeats (8 copies)